MFKVRKVFTHGKDLGHANLHVGIAGAHLVDESIKRRQNGVNVEVAPDLCRLLNKKTSSDGLMIRTSLVPTIREQLASVKEHQTR